MKIEDLCYGKVNRILDEKQEVPDDFNYLHASAGIIPEGIKRIRIKCPDCGRRVMSSISTCHDGCCIYHNLPPHKPKGWWKKEKKRGRKRKNRNRTIRRR